MRLLSVVYREDCAPNRFVEQMVACLLSLPMFFFLTFAKEREIKIALVDMDCYINQVIFS